MDAQSSVPKELISFEYFFFKLSKVTYHGIKRKQLQRAFPHYYKYIPRDKSIQYTTVYNC